MGLRQKIEAILPRVIRPTRYLGNELNVTRKQDARVRVALCFPEVYEIGMSWPGQQILYSLLNGADGVAAERCYAFWPDMEERMRESGVPAFSLETWTPLAEFDIVGFTLQYELVFTNLLCMLDLAGIPLRTAERERSHPLILAGGPVAYNAEPLADFLDAIVLGDGEDVFLEVCEVYETWKSSGDDRHALLLALSKLEGVYVPSFYDVEYHDEPVEGWSMGAIRSVTPRHGAPPSVRRRFVEDLNRVPFPSKPIVPLGQTVHNRLGIEVQRGCTRACRFCQAGYIYRPERQRHPEEVKRLVAESLKNTGYDDISLLSLSIGDFGCLDELLGDLLGPQSRGTTNLHVSLPSIRVDTLTEGIVDKIASAKKTGFTMAPEAGSPRLRDVINKALSEEQIATAAEMVFQRGWSHIKFYYMIGIPSETDDDVMGIVRTARMCQDIGRKFTKKANIFVSTSTFIPKPFTPFQWEPQIPREETLRKQSLLRHELKKTGLTYKWHDAHESFVEAVLSRGDRRLAPAVEYAFRKGARFDGWNEYFDLELWKEAFAATGVEPGFYAHRRIPTDEILAWDHIDCGVTKEWLIKDYEFGLKEKFIPDCATGRCYDCGVCDFEVVKNRTYLSKESGYIPQGQKAKGIGEHPYEIETANKPTLADMLPAAPHGTSKDAQRVRVRYAKTGRAAYLGHLDMMEHIARAFRRAGVRLAYSQGYHPRPKLSFGPALMTGAVSQSEYFDADILPPLPDAEWIQSINDGLPQGLALMSAHAIDSKTPKIGKAMTGVVFEVTDRLPGTLPDFEARQRAVAHFLATDVVAIEGKRRTYNAREIVRDVMATPEGIRLDIVFDTETGSARPTDVVATLLGWDDPKRVDGLLVTKLWTRFGDVRDDHPTGNTEGESWPSYSWPS